MNQQLNNAFTLFLSLLVEAMPFLLLGFAPVLLLFIDERQLIAAAQNPLLGALVGSMVGLIPRVSAAMCQCAAITDAGVPAPVVLVFTGSSDH